MKKFSSLFLCAVAAMAAVSCSKEIQNEQPTPEVELFPMTITATSTDTKTELVDQVSIKWLTTDKLSVFDGTGNREFTSTGEGKTVEFDGEVAEAATYYALYPYNAEASISGTTVNTTLSANQPAKAGSFADGFNINAAAAAATEDFHFTNVLSVAKLSVAATNLDRHSIASISLTSTHNLAGDVVVSYGDNITAAAGTNAVKEITLTSENGLADGDYYFCLLPNAGGEITLTFTDTDGMTATKTATLTKPFTAGTIKNLGSVKNLTWEGSTPAATGYELVTEAPADWSGKYVIAYTANGKAKLLGAKSSGGNYSSISDDITVQENLIPIDNGLTYEVEISKTTNGYSILVENDETYIGYTSTSTSSNNYLYYNTKFEASKYEWTLSLDSSGNAVIKSVYNSGRTIRYNTQTPRFACYTSGQGAIQLYKINGVVVERALESISLSDQKTEFKEGEDFVFGGTVTATYDNGSTVDVTNSVTFSEVDLSVLGKQTVTVSYAEKGITKTAEYEIDVVAKSLVSIEISGYTTALPQNSAFVFGGTVTARYDNGKTADVTEEATFSGYNMSTAGDQTIMVSYTEAEVTKTATYTLQITSTESEWTKMNLSEISVNDAFVIVGTVNGNTFAVSNDNGTSGEPSAVVVTIAGNYLLGNVDDTIQWRIAANEDNSYTFYPNGKSTWLYCNTAAQSGSNDNLRVGSGNRNKWALDENNYLITKDDNVTRYVSKYNDGWRGYINTSNNPGEFSFYVKTGAAVVPSITALTISGQKTRFNVGDTFSFGGTVKATYSDGTQVTLSSEDYSVDDSAVNMNTAGDYTVTVSAGTVSTTYDITVADSSAGTIILSEEFDNNCTSDESTAISSQSFSNFSGATSKAYKSQYGGIKLGTGSAVGYITSRTLDLSSRFTVTINVLKYGSDTGKIQITVGSETKEITPTDTDTVYTVEFGAATSSSVIKIGTSSNRAYIDNVIVKTL